MDESFHGYDAPQGTVITHEPARTDVLLHCGRRGHGDFHLHHTDTVLNAGNGRIWADWAVTGLRQGTLLALPFIGWLPQRLRLPVLFGWCELELRVNGMPWEPQRITSWYEASAIPVSEFVSGAQRVRAWCTALPGEERICLGLTTQNMQNVEIIIRGATTLGEEGGSPFDAVNGTIGTCLPLPSVLDCTPLPNGLLVRNLPAGLSAQLTFTGQCDTQTHRNTISQKIGDHVLERQQIAFELFCHLTATENESAEFAGELQLSDVPSTFHTNSTLNSTLSDARSLCQQEWSCLETIETPDALLTAALKRAAVYAASLLAPIDTTGAAAGLCDHVSWPVDCARDTFHIASAMLLIKPELARAHLAFTLLDAIPRAGAGKSYVATGESRGHRDARLLDLAAYPLMELWRYWRATGDIDFVQQTGVRDTVATILDEVATWQDPRTGLLTSTERSSDEKCVFPCFIPGNAALCVCLEQMAQLWQELWDDPNRAAVLRTTAARLRHAVYTHAVVDDPEFGKMFAFEVGDPGENLLYDHADMPNLLSLARLGFCKVNDRIFRNTIRFAYSHRNQGYRGTADGKYAQLCDGSKTLPFSPWALGSLGQLMSGIATPADVARCLDWLRDALTAAFQLPEISDKHTAQPMQRYWFGWPTAMLFMAYIETVCGVKIAPDIRVDPLIPEGWQAFSSPRIIIRGHDLQVSVRKGHPMVYLDGNAQPVGKNLPLLHN